VNKCENHVKKFENVKKCEKGEKCEMGFVVLCGGWFLAGFGWFSFKIADFKGSGWLGRAGWAGRVGRAGWAGWAGLDNGKCENI